MRLRVHCLSFSDTIASSSRPGSRLIDAEKDPNIAHAQKVALGAIVTTISKFQLFHFRFPFQFSVSAFRFRFPFPASVSTCPT